MVSVKTRILGLLIAISTLPLFFIIQGLFGLSLFLASTYLIILIKYDFSNVFLYKFKVIYFSLLVLLIITISAAGLYYLNDCIPSSINRSCRDIISIWGWGIMIISIPLGFYVYFTNDLGANNSDTQD